MKEQDYADIVVYVTQRDAALESGDFDWIRQRLPDGTDETVLLWTFHKARYEAVNVSREKRLESAEFLRENGLMRSCGLPLLPEGELPV